MLLWNWRNASKGARDNFNYGRFLYERLGSAQEDRVLRCLKKALELAASESFASEVRLKIVEFILEAYPARAPEALRTFPEENDALRLKFYETAADSLGQASLPLLLEGLFYDWDPKTEYGFLKYPAYLRRILELMEPMDSFESRKKIWTTFGEHKDRE